MAYFRCSDEIHSRLKVYAAERNLSMLELVDKWVAEGIEQKPSPTVLDGLKPRDRALVERYANALRLSRDPEFLGIIETMLDRIDMPDAPAGKRKAG